jgi:arabinogalactan oligomer/maltooligosaccharide transport system permease protein
MEVGFFFYLLVMGITAISHFDDLGENTQGMVLDEAKGIYIKSDGDNSMLLLLAAITAVFIIVAFVLMWRASIISGFKAQKLKEEGKNVPNFFDDIKAHFDGKLHKTLMFLPIVSVILFNILPLVFMITIAFTNFDGEHQPPGNLFDWVGLSNFATMLNSTSIIGKTFWPVLVWTLIWAVFSTFLNYIGGMLLAIIINRKGTMFKKLWRMIFVISIAVPQFVSLLVMRSMLAEKGAVNIMLMNAGIIDKALPFFTEPTWARVSVIIVNLWVGIPFTMLITSGILQNIPADLYESAKVDGANAFVTFFRITLPYMLFVTTPYLITQFVGNINNFNVIYFLTGGLPQTNDYYQAGHTDLLVTWLYKLTVNTFDYSYAAVIGIFVFIISAALSLVTYRRTGSYKNEEEFQ